MDISAYLRDKEGYKDWKILWKKKRKGKWMCVGGEDKERIGKK